MNGEMASPGSRCSLGADLPIERESQALRIGLSELRPCERCVILASQTSRSLNILGVSTEQVTLLRSRHRIIEGPVESVTAAKPDLLLQVSGIMGRQQ